jgi:hypothetical protein
MKRLPLPWEGAASCWYCGAPNPGHKGAKSLLKRMRRPDPRYPLNPKSDIGDGGSESGFGFELGVCGWT